ncbi:hypothetical protein [Streptomyces sp. NPDC086787]|uniref:hypothetical protein n=1 Tax=Streptomyces sp. NPDC086787 TaxID=3365759 RepID=UPI0037FF93F0
MTAFRLDLPPCQTENVTSSGDTSSMEARLALSFTAPKNCVTQYLKDHQVDVTNPVQWPRPAPSIMDGVALSPTRPPFTEGVMKQFHLTLDPHKKYATYHDFRTPKEAEFRVLLVPQGQKTAVYMESLVAGNVGKPD